MYWLDYQVTRREWHAHYRDIECAGPDCGCHVGSVAIVEVQCNVRQLLAHLPNDCRQDADCRRRPEADAQRASITACRSPNPINDSVASRDEVVRGAQQFFARRGQRDATTGSQEEFNVEITFQSADLLAEWRLRHANSRRRAAKMKFLGDGDKQFQPTNIDHDVFGLNP